MVLSILVLILLVVMFIAQLQLFKIKNLLQQLVDMERARRD